MNTLKNHLEHREKSELIAIITHMLRQEPDLQAVKALMRGTYVAFASSDIAERLAGSVAGTILPFSFHPELELVVDPSLLENDEIYFNAARLDRSLVLKTSDYVSLAKPRLGRIAGSQ